MHTCSGYNSCRSENHVIYAKDDDLVFMKCQDCELIWRSNDSLHIRKEYDSDYFNSKNYLKNRGHKIKKSEGLLRLAKHFQPNLKNMLEVGCSVGNTLQAAKNLKINHLGIDISLFAVNFCKDMGLNAECVSIEHLIMQKERYDLIFMQHVLEHFTHPAIVLTQCHQLLNKNGLILILVPNSRYKRAEKKREQHRFYNKKGVGAEHYTYFNYTTLSAMLQSSGFNVLQKNYPTFVRNSNSPYNLFNRIFRKSLSILKFDQEIIILAQKVNAVVKN